ERAHERRGVGDQLRDPACPGHLIAISFREISELALDLGGRAGRHRPGAHNRCARLLFGHAASAKKSKCPFHNVARDTSYFAERAIAEEFNGLVREFVDTRGGRSYQLS